MKTFTFDEYTADPIGVRWEIERRARVERARAMHELWQGLKAIARSLFRLSPPLSV
jgi:hypothetical protein